MNHLEEPKNSVQGEKEEKMRPIDADEVYGKRFTVVDVIEGVPIHRNVVKAVDVKEAPTVDAVEVVRCKDCIHNQLPPTRGNADCELWYGMTDLYGYCSRGEKKENDRN